MIFGLVIPITMEILSKKKFRDKLLNQPVSFEFQEVYTKLYNENFKKLEKLRQRARIEALITYILLILPIVVWYTTFDDFYAILGFILYFIVSAVFRKNRIAYKKTYKIEIISSFIKLLNSDLKYIPLGYRTYEVKYDYIDANFDNKKFNIFLHDDYIEGHLNENIIAKISDICVKYERKNGEARFAEELFEELFNGLFVSTNCNKNINNTIKISRNKLKILEHKTKVEIDSQEFEKYFNVYSDDKILTMRILSSELIQSMTDFYNKYNLDFEIVLKNDNIYLRFYTGPMFEPKLFGNSMDIEILFTYYFILQFVIEVTTKINKVLDEIEL